MSTNGLEQKHQELLEQESGITPDVIAERGYRTVGDPKELRDLGFSPTQSKLVPALLIPQHGVGGGEVGYQIRPDNPRTDGRTKPPRVRKYEFPAGAPGHIDVPPRVHPNIGGTSDLFITEGSRKADAAASIGLDCLALSGVYGWRGKNDQGGRTASADWESINCSGRTIYLVPDSDVATNLQVRKAMQRLAKFLTSKGATVHLVVLQPRPNGDKVGLDDLLATAPGMVDKGTVLSMVQDALLEEPVAEKVDAALRDYILENYDLYQTPERTPYAVPVDADNNLVRMFEGSGGLEYEAPYRFAESLADKPVIQAHVTKDVLRAVKAAAYEAPTRQLHLRAAMVDDDGLVVDLGDREGTAAIVRAGQWALTSKPGDVLFRRTTFVQPLPRPQRGGSLDLLRDLLNVDDEGWALVLGWLINVPFAEVARPLLEFSGHQGSGKSVGALLTLNCWDPRGAMSSPQTKQSRSDPGAQAANQYLLSWDNYSKIDNETSDWLCSLVTGAEDVRRVLHTTADTVSFRYKRTGIITHVGMSGLRADLIERLVRVEFERPSVYRSEGEIRRSFERDHPLILGALLDAVAQVLTHLPQARATPGTRLADYARRLHAYDLANGTDLLGAFDRASAQNMQEAAEDDPLTARTVQYATTLSDTGWVTPTALYEALGAATPRLMGDETWWPGSGAVLARYLGERVVPLANVGVMFTKRKSNGVRQVRVVRQASLSAPYPSLQSSLQSSLDHTATDLQVSSSETSQGTVGTVDPLKLNNADQVISGVQSTKSSLERPGEPSLPAPVVPAGPDRPSEDGNPRSVAVSADEATSAPQQNRRSVAVQRTLDLPPGFERGHLRPTDPIYRTPTWPTGWVTPEQEHTQ